jgi:hypothetical protein
MAIYHITNWLEALPARKEAPAAAWSPSIPSLPGEDAFFFQKPIDNSRVIKAQNPHDHGVCWRDIVISSAAVWLGFGLLAPAAIERVATIQLTELRSSNDKIRREIQDAEAAIAELRSPERLKKLAEQHNFDLNTNPSDRLHLNPMGEGLEARNSIPSSIGAQE